MLYLSGVSCVPIVFLLILGSFPYSPSLSYLLTLHPDKVNRSQRTTRHFSRGDTKLNTIYSREGGGMGKGQLQKTIWICSQSLSLMPLLKTQPPISSPSPTSASANRIWLSGLFQLACTMLAHKVLSV